jgi:hypothetical protein
MKHVNLCIIFISTFYCNALSSLQAPPFDAEIKEVLASQNFRIGVCQVQQYVTHATWPHKPQQVTGADFEKSQAFKAALIELKQRIKTRTVPESQQTFIQGDDPLNWLKEIYMLAALTPKTNHTGLDSDLAGLKPTPQDMVATLATLRNNTLRDLQEDIRQFAQPNDPLTQAFISSIETFQANQANILSPYAKESLSYVQKLIVQPRDKIYFVGDIHGSIGALVRNMRIWRAIDLLNENFKIRPNNYLVFLGDYVDYGQHSLLVLYSILKLKLLNWNSVILLRGNHETEGDSDTYAFVKHMQSLYGDMKYLKALFGAQIPKEIQDAGKFFYNICVINCFNILPLALYIGINGHQPFIQCCHGGIEPGYNPKMFLAGKNNYQNFIFNPYDVQDDVLKAVSNEPEKLKISLEDALLEAQQHALAQRIDSTHIRLVDPSTSGFLWSDFYTLPGLNFNLARQTGFSADQTTATNSAKACNVCAYIRGHQHQQGIKLGDIRQEKDGSKNARWVNTFPDKAGKPSEKFIESADLPFALRFSAQSSQEGFSTSLKNFEQSFPIFSLSDFANKVPIITLTTASEASTNNMWDSFCVVTIDPDISKSCVRIYEAEARSTEQAHSIITTILEPEKEQLIQQKSDILSYALTLPTTEYCILALGLIEKRLLTDVAQEQQNAIKFHYLKDLRAALKKERANPDSILSKDQQKVDHLEWYITAKSRSIGSNT